MGEGSNEIARYLFSAGMKTGAIVVLVNIGFTW